MQDELTELLETATCKQIPSHAFYVAAQNRSEDQGAEVLMKELAEEELRHSQTLEELQEKYWKEGHWHRAEIPNLMITEYLTGGDKPEGASLQDTLVFAMKRKQHAVEFHSEIMSVIREEAAKHLCERFATEELKHRLRLEIFYDDFVYGED
jgi:rubrerythrin